MISGSEHDPLTGAHIAPIYRTSTYVMKDMDTAIKAGYGDVEGLYAYTRYGNPTNHAVERKIAAIEGAEDCVVTASGMCAISTTLLSPLSAGDHMILADTVYGGTFEFVHNILPRFGVEFTSVSGINKLSLPHQHSKLTGATTLICAVALLIFGSRLLHTHDQAETADLY